MLQVKAASILIFTIGLSLARPRVGPIRIRPEFAAVAGAVLTLVAGLLSPPAAYDVLLFLAPPLVTIASLMVITIVAEQAGIFRLLAWRVARSAGGNGRRLFAYLFFAGTATGALFTNDAAVLNFTPMVFLLIEEVSEESWTVANKVPYYFAVLYVANLVGPLVISNPINIVVSDWFGIGFLEYAAWMVAPALMSFVVTYVGLRLFFRRAIPDGYRVPPPVAVDPAGRRFMVLAAGVLLLTLVGFFSGHWTGIPTAAVAFGGAVLLTAVYRLTARGQVRGIARKVGWDVLIFVVGIFLVASGLRTAGLTDVLGRFILEATAGGEGSGHLTTGFVAGLSSAVLNNHPVAQIMALSIRDLALPEVTERSLAFAALIGGDLGPKMLPIGSLAALMWFRMLRDRGVEIPYAQYIRLGVPVTLAAILLSVLTLNLELSLFGSG